MFLAIVFECVHNNTIPLQLENANQVQSLPPPLKFKWDLEAFVVKESKGAWQGRRKV